MPHRINFWEITILSKESITLHYSPSACFTIYICSCLFLLQLISAKKKGNLKIKLLRIIFGKRPKQKYIVNQTFNESW